MIQALHAILGTASDKTVVKMLYGSRDSGNILGKEFLGKLTTWYFLCYKNAMETIQISFLHIDKWAASHKKRLSVQYVLSAEPEDSSWEGGM